MTTANLAATLISNPADQDSTQQAVRDALVASLGINGTPRNRLHVVATCPVCAATYVDPTEVRSFLAGQCTVCEGQAERALHAYKIVSGAVRELEAAAGVPEPVPSVLNAIHRAAWDLECAVSPAISLGDRIETLRKDLQYDQLPRLRAEIRQGRRELGE